MHQLSYRLDGEKEENMNLYGIEKRTTIEDKPVMSATLDETRDACHIERLHYVTCADVPAI